MTCGNGGYIIKRHNILSNLDAKLLENVCKDMKIKPALLPTTNAIKGNRSEGTRLDISVAIVFHGSPPLCHPHQNKNFSTFPPL